MFVKRERKGCPGALQSGAPLGKHGEPSEALERLPELGKRGRRKGNEETEADGGG